MRTKAVVPKLPDVVFNHVSWRYFTAEDGTFQIWTDKIGGYGVNRGSFAAILLDVDGVKQLDRRYCATRREAKDRCRAWLLERSPKREERQAYVIREEP